jgi:hypothetical protein
MDLQLKGKKALITGSTAGIGFATARGLAAEGASVIVNGRTEKRVDSAVSEIRKAHPGADVSGVAADVSNAPGCAKLIQAVGAVDVLINNMGIFEPKPFEKIPDEDWFALLRSQRHERCAPLPPLSRRHAQKKLGTNRVHLQRIRSSDSRRNDSLRHDQDRANRHRSRHRGNRRRNRHHREQRATRTH